ncbi:MAG: dephospho-CoA kinase [Clostridiales bacterium]|nr:dephospho-CoA kinase [Candidatus Crickella equi]
MKTIAITGGIGSGKSTATKYLQEQGYIVIDADKMARELTEPGGRAIPYIREHFGNAYIREDGSMDRAKMRDLIFKDFSQKEILEEGTTKVVLKDIDNIKAEAAENGVHAIFFDIPLLFETKTNRDYDYVWVVTADRDLRKERVILRDGIDEHIIELIIGSQSEEEDKIKFADEVIYNNGSIEELHKSIDKLLETL